MLRKLKSNCLPLQVFPDVLNLKERFKFFSYAIENFNAKVVDERRRVVPHQLNVCSESESCTRLRSEIVEDEEFS